MRETDLLTVSKPTGFMSVDFDAIAIQFSNPTLSPILYRQGGTDFPSINFADFVVPAQSLVRLPAVGKEFGYGFQNTAVLSNSNITVARVTVLDARETLASIGSVQPVARPAYYERERNPVTLGNFFRDILITNFSPNATELVYTCPANRKARIASAQIEFYSTVSFTPGAVDVVSAAIEVPSVKTPASPSIVCNLQTLVTGVNQATNRSLSVEYILNPGDEILYNCGSQNFPASFSYDLVFTTSLTEFDF